MALDFSSKDPVCGMTLESLQARGKAQYQGATYLFLLARLYAQVHRGAGEICAS